MNIETHCITDLRSAKAVIAIHKKRNPKLNRLEVPLAVKMILWGEVGMGRGSIRTDYFETRYTTLEPTRTVLIVGGVEIIGHEG